jgi:DNA repair exonuclease SbcCD ATPase subunit
MKPLVKSPKALTRAEELAAEKLELEIAELKKKWWQKTAYLQVLLPLTLAVITATGALLVSWSNGFFDVQRAKLQQERNRLMEQNAEMKREDEGLRKQVADTRATLAALVAREAELHKQAELLDKQLERAAKDLRDDGIKRLAPKQ